MRNAFRIAAVAAFGLGVLTLALVLLQRRATLPVLPVPNGYDDFLQAAQHVVHRDHPALGQADEEELKEIVAANLPARKWVRTGYAKDCRMAIDYQVKSADYFSKHMPVLGQFKALALDFRTEGELAEREGRTNDAVSAYLDGIRFGHEFCRGGLLIDRLVGVSCEAINFAPLSNLVQQLDGPACRKAAQALEKMEDRRETWETSVGLEQHYFRVVASPLENLAGIVYQVVEWVKSWWAPAANPRQKLERIQRSERRLTLRLAARAYEIEKGRPPEKPSDLVPDFLRATPKDPNTGQDMGLVR